MHIVDSKMHPFRTFRLHSHDNFPTRGNSFNSRILIKFPSRKKLLKSCHTYGLIKIVVGQPDCDLIAAT